MASTTTHQGIDVDAKPSSRVLRPPGGSSSDIFGTGGNLRVEEKKSDTPSKEAEKPAKPQSTGNRIFGDDVEEKKTKVIKDEGDEDQESKSSEKKTNPAVVNPITGETMNFTIGGQGETTTRPSTRVHAPPGGYSTPLW